MERIVITGSSGFYGRAMIAAIRGEFPAALILGLDVVAAKTNPPDLFETCDITSSRLKDVIAEFRPDTVVHLAFVVNPMHDEVRMHQINVNGTRNLLAAVNEVRPARLLVSSSATAYGAWPDNCIPLTEEHPLRTRTEYCYAHDKFQVETMLQEFSATQLQTKVSWTRPCMIYGPGMSNFMTALLTTTPMLPLPGGDNPPMQFVHLDDVAEASLEILKANATGPFNVAPADWFTMQDLARMRGRLALPIPFWVCRAFTTCWWGLRLPVFRFPASLWYFIRYPWIITPARLTKEVGYKFRYSSKDVIRLLLKDAGKLTHNF
ncbi:MAG: NAD-dependent epimerase/dehydratase family protein [Planctomycetota bacterium]